MFKVSTKGDYALLLMTALAEKWEAPDGSFVSLKKIAKEKHLSFPYLSQLVLSLKKAGLVESKEGFSGGYRLSQNPSEISLISILEATEGKIAPVKCCREKENQCQCETVCDVKYAWQDAIEILRHFLQTRKLSHLVKGKGQKESIIFPLSSS